MKTITVTKAKKRWDGTNQAETFNIPKSAGNKKQIYAKGGNDIINVKGGKGHVINTGTGNDTVNLNYGNSHTVTLGAAKKKNTVNVTKGTGHTITGSNKVDVLNISGGTVKSANLGKGNDIITVSKKGVLQKLDAGIGHDSVTLKGTSANNYIIGGAGNDTITIETTAKNLVVGSAGNDTYVINNVNSNVIIDNSTGWTNTDKDKLKINTNSVAFASLLDSEVIYDDTSDILKCRNFYVIGFSKLSAVIDGNNTSYNVNAPNYIPGIPNNMSLLQIAEAHAQSGSLSGILAEANKIKGV